MGNMYEDVFKFHKYMYEDVFEFQQKHPSIEEKEEALRRMSDREIRHLVDTCPNVTGKIWYKNHMTNPDYVEVDE